MGRGYQRKTSKGSFEKSDMEKAVDLVIDENYSYEYAAQQFENIKPKTLWR